jgi:hypothetical protein
MAVSEHRPCELRSVAIQEVSQMHSIVYLIGLIVIVLAILSFLGLR